jgi:hypothetical protein
MARLSKRRRRNPRHTVSWKGRRWERQDDGSWVDLSTGLVDPRAEDMTISNLYNFRVIRHGKQEFVQVPYALSASEPELRWAQAFKRYSDPEEGEEWKGSMERVIQDYGGRRIILVPRLQWLRAEERVGVIGMWHPEIK